MKQPVINSGQRLPELDGVRGLAILLVLLWHYVQNQLASTPGEAFVLIRQSLGFAWSGVDLFFVLSGFLITGILLDNRDKANYFKVFYLRRSCRIFPLYYTWLLIFMAMSYLGAGDIAFMHRLIHMDGIPVWSYLTYTQNIMMDVRHSAGPGWLAVTWSLAIEEQFYLVLPLLVRLIPVERLPYVFAWFIVSAVMLRYTQPGLSAYINMPWRADSLITGALLAYALRLPGVVKSLENHRHLVTVSLLMVFTGLVVANYRGELVLGGPLTHLALAVLFGLLLLYVLSYRDSVLARAMRWRALAWLGTISYGVYLLHTSLSGLLHGLIRGARPAMADWQGAMVTLLALAATLLLAHISFIVFEKRFIHFGHRYKYE